jgi:hypothetical protein
MYFVTTNKGGADIGSKHFKLRGWNMSSFGLVKKANSEVLEPMIHRAITHLIQNQVSDTLILSSYKLNTVMKNYLGQEFKVEQIGRHLARIAKQHKLKKLGTKIPKYELKKNKFAAFERL